MLNAGQVYNHAMWPSLFQIWIMCPAPKGHMTKNFCYGKYSRKIFFTTTSSFFLGTIIRHFLVFSMNLYWQEQICLVC